MTKNDEFTWKELRGEIRIDNLDKSALYAAVIASMDNAEALLAGKQSPMTDEDWAALARERRRPINRLRRFFHTWRWRLADAWDALMGRGPSEGEF